MRASPDSNFAGRLVNRLGAASYLIDAARGETICPSELRLLISGFASGFVSAGFKPGDRVVIGCALSSLSSIAYLGAMYAGLVAVPVEEGALVTAGNIIIRETKARGVWLERALVSDLACQAEILRVTGDLTRGMASVVLPAPCRETDLASLMATSGSTGTPRFVMVSHGNLIANTEAIIRSQHLGNDERAMLVLPVSYCFGASILHTHLYQGGGVVFDRRFMFPDKVLRAISQHECTTFAGVPSVYNILLHRSNIRSIGIPSVRRFLQAGGPLGPERIIEMRGIVPAAQFYVMYGQTEATARICTLDPVRLGDKLGSVGQPLDNLRVRIVSEDGRDLSPKEVGEIVITGPSICQGYLNDAEESRRVFDHGWLRTRDLGFLDEDGFLWIKGRKGGFVKMVGIRVSLSEVENYVADIPGVRECAAEVVSHPESGEAVALWIVADTGSDEMVERVRRALPPKWICPSINIVSALPKTSSGKVARPLLSLPADVRMQDVYSRVQQLLRAPPYGLAPDEKSVILFDLLKELIERACTRNERFRNYVNCWPTPFLLARKIEALPYLPVAAFKANPPISLVAPDEVKRILISSATTGQDPSRVVLDSSTAHLMAKAVMAITKDFIGSNRRPYLVVDLPASAGTAHELGARGAAIQGLQSFATEAFYCLTNSHDGETQLDVEGLLRFAERQRTSCMLVYGFTYMLWNHLVRPLRAQGICLETPNVHVLHSGGWKRLQEQAVDKGAFNEGVAQVFGCSRNRVIDFLGMVENVGIIYPDCQQGNKHAPTFGEVIVRDPLTLEPVTEGSSGLLQVCSVLPTSFPGYLLLTDDMAEVVAYDGCGCGRRGIAFRFMGRVPKSEIRGCGNMQSSRSAPNLTSE